MARRTWAITVFTVIGVVAAAWLMYRRPPSSVDGRPPRADLPATPRAFDTSDFRLRNEWKSSLLAQGVSIREWIVFKEGMSMSTPNLITIRSGTIDYALGGAMDMKGFLEGIQGAEAALEYSRLLRVIFPHDPRYPTPLVPMNEDSDEYSAAGVPAEWLERWGGSPASSREQGGRFIVERLALTHDAGGRDNVARIRETIGRDGSFSWEPVLIVERGIHGLSSLKLHQHARLTRRARP